MQKILLALLLIAAGAAAQSAPLPRSTPEEQGVSSAGILDFVEAADKGIDTMNSFMVVRHGKVVAEGWWSPYAAETRHAMHSLSKSFTSTAVGLAIADGKFSLDDPILKFFPDKAPSEPGQNLKAMRVRDLLIMSSGHSDKDLSTVDLQSPQPSQSFLNSTIAYKPGTHFLYNTPATYMLSAIVQKTTGEKVLDYLRPRLFEPLGIENPKWEESAEGVSLGGYGLSVRTEDIARFGLLYLHKGEWQGKQLVPAAWIEAATSRQTSTGSSPTSDWDQGYGYQFWRSRHGYRGDGAFGQFCFVLAEQDAVVAITSGGRDMQAVMNLVWDRLLPAMQAASLPANDVDRKKLAARLSQLEVRRQEGKASPRLSASISGKSYVFEENPAKIQKFSLDWKSKRDEPVVALTIAGTEQRETCAKGAAWKKIVVKGNTAMPEQRAAISCAWKSGDTFAIKTVAVETAFYINFQFRFTSREVFLEQTYNVGHTETTRLTGKAQ